MSGDTVWLDPGERDMWLAMSFALIAMPAAVDAQLKRDAGLNAFEYSILVSLSEQPGTGLRMTNLAMITGGSLSRLSHAVSRLERQGWVRRQVQTGEVRCTEAVLTDQGRQALEAAAPGHVREVRRLVFDVLTRAEVDQLGEVFRRMLRAAAPETADFLERAIRPGATDRD